MPGLHQQSGKWSELKKHTITKQTIQGSTELAPGFCQIRKDIDKKTFKTQNRIVDKQVRHIHSGAVALLTFKTNSLLPKMQLGIKLKSFLHRQEL